MELEGIVSKRVGSVCERQDTRLAEHEEPGILERETLCRISRPGLLSRGTETAPHPICCRQCYKH